MASQKTPPPPKPLALKRLALPDKPSQGWVADQISDRIGETVGQQAVSYWENGKVDLKKVHPRRLAAYAEVLKISLQELADSAGYSFEELFPENYRQAVFYIDNGVSKPSTVYREVPPRGRPLPQGLQDAIDAFGKRYPDLLNPAWQQYLAGFQWRRGIPEDPTAWLDLYRDLDRAGVVPGEG